MGFKDHDRLELKSAQEPSEGELIIEDTNPRGLAPQPAGPLPALAGYRTFILGMVPAFLALTAIVVLATQRPDLLSVENLMIIIGLGSTGPGAATLARSIDKRTAFKRLTGG